MSQLFSAVEAREGRIVVGRLLPGADLIRGLESVCDEHAIRFAAVVFAYGSLASASFKTLQRVPGKERPELLPRTIEDRVEFLGGQGLVCRNEQGGRETHLHGSVAKSDGVVMGGHFNPDENPIFNNMDYALAELLDVDLVRGWDEHTQTVEMTVGPLG
jgi:predicted DNA-binding protein with PD1-like motif